MADSGGKWWNGLIGASTKSDGAVSQGKLSAGMGMAVGSRAHLEKDAVAKRTAARNFLMHGFHLLVVAVAGPAVRDTQCGFKVSVLLRPSRYHSFAV